MAQHRLIQATCAFTQSIQLNRKILKSNSNGPKTYLQPISHHCLPTPISAQAAPCLFVCLSTCLSVCLSSHKRVEATEIRNRKNDSLLAEFVRFCQNFCLQFHQKYYAPKPFSSRVRLSLTDSFTVRLVEFYSSALVYG